MTFFLVTGIYPNTSEEVLGFGTDEGLAWYAAQMNERTLFRHQFVAYKLHQIPLVD